MQLIVNGDVRAIEGVPSLDAFLASRGLQARMVVVERNGEIVPRDRYEETPLVEGDVLEIVQMMAGG